MLSRQLMISGLAISLILFFMVPERLVAEEEQIHKERMDLYKKTEALTQVPWYYLAAIDQYERSIRTDPPEDQIISIAFEPEIWFGPGNSSMEQDGDIIEVFDGKGKDGNGDGMANPDNDEDILYTMANILLEQGPTEDDFRIALWHYYQRDLTVQSIKNTAKVFKEFETTNLGDRDFPLSTEHNYSLLSTWGDRRGYGGLRIHEGTDIFANYGVPVKATTYGVIELKGWNRFGGWRIGIRDIHNIYHYYGHMSGYEDGVKVGQVVKPGDDLGSVGSTGYGPPGTSGKFPPHLHYGMYRDNGYSEWSFDPYPYLKKWERMAKD